ncbi:MAG: diguanylate cyclase, partial [Desulfobacterales bacterium]|nr:diguanylate cyclase [Desulfobacterales bacterium]
GKEAWDFIQNSDAPNLIISDWMMPKMDGLELCRKIRLMKRSSYIYFIILTSKGSKEDVVKGLDAGADDFLVKPFDYEELKYRVKIGERIIDLEQRIMTLANTDALTNVLNRRAFMERMDQEVQRAVREKTSLSFLITDIDHFKNVNDKYGHQAGDVVLKLVANQFKLFSRPYDFVGRYGGEEFVVGIPGADSIQLNGIAERMRKRLELMDMLLPNGSGPIRITASFGVASLEINSGENLDSLIRRADEALYRAKEKGRNCVCSTDEKTLQLTGTSER